ncbi:glutathione peroxidase [Myroides injenensis]|uniref:glutathione peroxidase n=1 Tax=Myroides injenensis TaxID=1183151 RepID=UPI002271ED93|nr:glutathione peroxidase [Myroides injenensis]
MKKIVLLLGLTLTTTAFANISPTINTENTNIMNKQKDKQTIYQFKVEDLSGNEFDLASLKGKKVMIVNTASECGLTPQYEQLQSMYNEFGGDKFVIIGFPANNFGAQEPGSNAEIATFCQANYGVTFPMMSKISVKGEDIAPIYAFLTQKEKNGLQDSEVEWNFQKYLIDQTGHLVKVIGPRVLPNDPEIKEWVKAK